MKRALQKMGCDTKTIPYIKQINKNYLWLSFMYRKHRYNIDHPDVMQHISLYGMGFCLFCLWLDSHVFFASRWRVIVLWQVLRVPAPPHKAFFSDLHVLDCFNFLNRRGHIISGKSSQRNPIGHE